MTILPFTGIFDLFYKRRKETWCEIPNKNKGSLGVVAFLLSTMWSGFLENEKCYSIRNPRNENTKSLRLCFPELTRIDHAWSSQLCPRVQHMPSHSRCKMAQDPSPGHLWEGDFEGNWSSVSCLVRWREHCFAADYNLLHGDCTDGNQSWIDVSFLPQNKIG